MDLFDAENEADLSRFGIVREAEDRAKGLWSRMAGAFPNWLPGEDVEEARLLVVKQLGYAMAWAAAAAEIATLIEAAAFMNAYEAAEENRTRTLASLGELEAKTAGFRAARAWGMLRAEMITIMQWPGDFDSPPASFRAE